MKNKSFLLLLIAGTLLTFLVVLRVFPGTNPVATFPADDGRTHPDRSGDPAKEAAKPISLRMTVFGEPDVLKAFHSLIEQYQTNHPGVTIALSAMAKDDVYGAYQQQAWSSDPPDLALMDNAWVREFTSQGWLSGKAGEAVVPDLSRQQSPAVSKELTWNGYRWAMPLTVDPYVLARNRGAFASAGVAPPDTKAALDETAAALTDAGSGRLGLYVQPDDSTALITAAWVLEDPAVAGEKAGKDGKRGNSAVDEAEPYAPNGTKLSGEEAWQRLADGRIAMMIARSSDYLAHAGNGVDAVPLPGADGEEPLRSGWLNGLSVAVAAESRHEKEALAFAAWLSSPAAQSALAEAGRTMPADKLALSLLTDRDASDISTIETAIARSGTFEPGADMMERIREAGVAGNRWWTGELGRRPWQDAVSELQDAADSAMAVRDAGSASG